LATLLYTFHKENKEHYRLIAMSELTLIAAWVSLSMLGIIGITAASVCVFWCIWRKKRDARIRQRRREEENSDQTHYTNEKKSLLELSPSYDEQTL